MNHCQHTRLITYTKHDETFFITRMVIIRKLRGKFIIEYRLGFFEADAIGKPKIFGPLPELGRSLFQLS